MLRLIRVAQRKVKVAASTQDCEAGWNVKTASYGKRKSAYGFKAHLNVDGDGCSKVSFHNSNCFTELLSDDESVVYADSVYRSKKHEGWLGKRGIESRVIKRACRDQALTAKGALIACIPVFAVQ